MDGDAGAGDAGEGAREVPLDLERRGPRLGIGDVRRGGGPVPPVHGQQGAVPEDGVRQSVVAGGAGSHDRFRHGLVGGRLVAGGQVRERQEPEGEVAPATAGGFEGDRPRRVHQAVVRAGPAHRGSQHRAAGLERGGAIRWPTRERATLGDVREMLGGRDVARREFLPRAQDGEPRTLLERAVAEASDPRLHRDAARGPVIAAEAGAHQGGGMVEVAGREGVCDGLVEVACLLVPPGRSTVQRRGSARLTRLELVLQELPQQRVIAVPPAVLVDQDGRARKVGEQLA